MLLSINKLYNFRNKQVKIIDYSSAPNNPSNIVGVNTSNLPIKNCKIKYIKIVNVYNTGYSYNQGGQNNNLNTNKTNVVSFFNI